ncbi:hypothetical protein [Actinokineospora bangkokensis]|uniref:Alpha/beta hydrolase n=1 Tax=Actinokineospora bangkokensis TaxID=1193682 RepID=A0A1Q9LHZ8_9PSEU|nr:hypothetical protein [Actinokineospora bangkokensis]OLR91658.1 hypothetical protein BJP25_25385 [Actinokineospora bangkokensis]
MPVAPVTAVLVHSPLLGPATLRPLAAALTGLGHPPVLLDLLPSVAEPPVHQRLIGGFADAVSDAGLGGPLVLVGHGGAGPLLPAFAEELEDFEVRALVYLDAELPTPGRSVRELDPARYAAAKADERRWGEALAALVPEGPLRQEVLDELPGVSPAYLKEARPTALWSGPAAYLSLSTPRVAAAVRELGWPAWDLGLHHLACATHPEPVAHALLGVLAALRAG